MRRVLPFMKRGGYVVHFRCRWFSFEYCHRARSRSRIEHHIEQLMLGRLERTPARTKNCGKLGRTAKTATRGNPELDTARCERDAAIPMH